MTVGSGGASLAVALWGCTKQVSQRPGRPRVNNLTWLGGPTLLLLMAKDLGTRKGSLSKNIRSSQSFVLEAEVEGVPCWLVGALAGGSWSGLVGASK